MKSSQWANLLEALQDVDDVDRAVQASLDIAELADETCLPDLERLIHAADFFIRETAAVPLARLRGIAALPLLFEALTLGRQQGCDNDGLCTALSDVLLCHPAESKPVLLQMLADRSPDVRENAAWALGYISAEISPRPLLLALQDENPRVRACAAGSLGSFKLDEVVDALLPLLKDPDEQVRVSTAAALGYIGKTQAIPALQAARQDSSERVRRFAADAADALSHVFSSFYSRGKMTPCKTCELIARRDANAAPLWDSIHRTPFWDVVHSYNTALPGWLVLVARRHIAAIDELTEEEALELGALLRRVSLALKEATGCVKTYVIQFAEMAEHSHVHFHVVARMADQPENRRGTNVFGYLNVPEEERVSEEKMNEIALKVRKILL